MTNRGHHLHAESHSSSCRLGSCSPIPRVSWSTWAQVCGHADLDRAILLLTDVLLCSLPWWDGATEIQCIERKRALQKLMKAMFKNTGFVHPAPVWLDQKLHPSMSWLFVWCLNEPTAVMGFPSFCQGLQKKSYSKKRKAPAFIQ